MFEIDVNEANGRLFEYADRRLVRFGAPIESMPDQATMDRASGELSIHAAAHDLNNIVEWQLQASPQLADQRLLHARQTGGQCLRRMRAVGDGRAIAPTADCGLAYTQFVGKLRNRLPTALNISSGLRRGRRVGVKAQLHDARRSLMKAMPRSTPIPSNQSPGTKHLRGA